MGNSETLTVSETLTAANLSYSSLPHNPLLHMTVTEAQRQIIIAQAVERKLSEKTASDTLGLSIRQIQRLKNKYRHKGVSGMIHGLRGKRSNYQSPHEKEILYETIHGILLSDERYTGCGPLFTLEQLMKDHSYLFHSTSLTSQTLRSKMILWGLWKGKKTKEKIGENHLKWREPKETLGEMIQFDGSYHAWLEGRDGMDTNGKPNTCCLLLATDDATGKIMKAELTVNEGIRYIFPFWKKYIEDINLGKPYSLYLDKFATYKINYPTAGDTSDVVTQFGRVCRELNITLIFANSPQAKGRVERMNGTLQDRLVKALRFAQINTIPEANIFLDEIFIPEFNQKFARPAKNPEGNLHTPLSDKERDRDRQGFSLSSLFSIHEERKIQNDFTIRHENQFYQLYFSSGTTLLKQAKVQVQTWIDGSIHICHRGKEITYKPISKFQRESSYVSVKLAPVLST